MQSEVKWQVDGMAANVSGQRGSQMDRQEIVIEILPDGKVEYKITGVKGSGCESISALLESLGVVEAGERTDEYYEDEPDITISLGE
jgi:hypothetical protein